MLGQQKDLTLLNRNFNRRLAGSFHQAKENVALQLIEELLGRIVMIVSPMVRSPHDSHHHFAVLPNLRIPYRRLELLFVFLNPSLKVEGLQASNGWHCVSYLPGLYATARISISKCG